MLVVLMTFALDAEKPTMTRIEARRFLWSLYDAAPLESDDARRRRQLAHFAELFRNARTPSLLRTEADVARWRPSPLLERALRARGLSVDDVEEAARAL